MTSDLLLYFGLPLCLLAWIVGATMHRHYTAMREREAELRRRMYEHAARRRMADAVRRAAGDVWSRRAQSVDDLVGERTAPDCEWNDWRGGAA